MFHAAINSVGCFEDRSDTTKNYKDVLGPTSQGECWISMKCEFHTMESKGVWKIVPISSLTHGRRIVGNRWVYTEKTDEHHRSRTVAQGFCKVPGMDFTDSHAPVMNDLAFRSAI
jgi:Reverse transcriptase (RNA-dependent DNA polymerase)